MLNRIVFAAGGTGGHIYPAIAVADELKKINKGIKIKFIGAKGRIEEKIVPQNGYELETIDVQGFSRSLSPKNITVVLKFMKAVKEAKTFLKEFKPELVFGTGGFVSGPVIWSASQLGIISVIQEGNSYPGITVKWLSSKVNKVILNFEESKKYLKRQDNIEVMPYPVRTKLKKYPKQEARRYFGLADDKKTIFAFGGSQGAKKINEAILKHFRNFVNKNIQIIWQTGENINDKLLDKVKLYNSIKILKYIDNIDYAYSAADLVICRAGISTLMELASFGCAVVFVPYALASENHQEKNARTLADKYAAEVITEKDIDVIFEAEVLNLLNNDEKLNQMRDNIKAFSDAKAAVKISEMLVRLVNNSKN